MTTEQIAFDAQEIVSTFRVNQERRTISGMVVPWGKVARNGQGKWRFGEGSLYWIDESRTKLNLYHDHTQAVAKAVRLQSTATGLDASFQVARGVEGDRALSLAEDGVLDGFSVEIVFEDGDGWEPDPDDKSVRLVHRAKLRGVALTAMPAFDDARVSAVAASLNQGQETAMATDQVTPDPAIPAAQFDFDGFAKALSASLVESHTKLTEDLTTSLGESFSAAMKAALEDIHDPQGGPEPVRAARYTVTREAPIYTFDGAGPCLVRDAWYAQREHDDDAKERLRRFHTQTGEVAKLAAAEVSFQASEQFGQQFTTQTTTTGAAIIPPGYRPDLFVPMLAQDRPLVNALSRGTIANATPFVVPVFTTSTNLTDPHTEGNAPAEGGLTLGTKTVTPGAISGKLPLTREIVDSSNPAIDQIALAAMREDYARQTEANVYTLLNGSSGAGGTITTGFVPSGSQAATCAASADAKVLVHALRAALSKYPFARFAAPTMALMGQAATTLLATAKDTTERPLLPSTGATNSVGLGNAVTQGWFIDGLAHVPAWAMTGVAAGDTQVFTINRADGWAWESPVLAFRFEEKSGPQIIELALFGYFATHLLRPVGLSGMRIT
jgi:HK97 family phage major capsid protein/HK97 family phage prohead protease